MPDNEKKQPETPPLEPPPGPPGQQGIKIEIDETNIYGVYSNVVLISHTENEFVLDFIHILPQQGGARIRSRVLVGPKQMKRMLRAFTENMARYEQQFGIVTVTEPTGVPPGSQTPPPPPGGYPRA